MGEGVEVEVNRQPLDLDPPWFWKPGAAPAYKTHVAAC